MITKEGIVKANEFREFGSYESNQPTKCSVGESLVIANEFIEI